jgi:hypothetical protein
VLLMKGGLLTKGDAAVVGLYHRAKSGARHHRPNNQDLSLALTQGYIPKVSNYHSHVCSPSVS